MRHCQTLIPGLLALFAAMPGAQASSLTTLYASDVQNTAGGMNYFDLDVLAAGGITITQLGVNVTEGSPPVGSVINLDVYTRNGTVSGFQGAAAGWTLISSGFGVSTFNGTASLVDVTDFVLGPGITGIAIRNVDYNAAYTRTAPLTLVYGNADLTFNASAASNGLFGPTILSPRVWNGTVFYDVNAAPVPEPASLALLLAGGVALALWQRGHPPRRRSLG